ncbi:MAG: CRISPR-associated protein [Bacteroidaceae bacterium]|nr:CRISPR-associated protein [Bacteroidaceae bacterium]
MTKYLYGAAVQGIQGFIFQTNELKDIVGASELVETICSKDGLFEKYGKYANSILRAAGNIKHIFDSVEDCQNAVLNFPKDVMAAAPGITISQAVVKLEDNTDFAAAVDELEKRLRAQRNRPMPSTTLGLMGIKRSNKTGLPAKEIKGADYLDAAIVAKREKGDVRGLCQKAFVSEREEKEERRFVTYDEVAYNIEDITEKNDWIAIIHADGNGLGQVVQKVGKDKDKFKEFSTKLDQATKTAAVNAYGNKVKGLRVADKPIPVRPIVLGGDDFTVVCRADFAIEYVTEFMKEFELQTRSLLGKMLKENQVFDKGEDKLTACAGVAFIKSSYPFYYGYELAEELCSQAKKDAKDYNKDFAPSCLMFHKVQDSFVEDWKEIEKRELTPAEGLSFIYGPYYIGNEHGNKPSVDDLLKNVKLLDSKEGNAVKSHLRQWMSELHEGEDKAHQKAVRVSKLLSNKELKELFDSVTAGREETKDDKTNKVFAAYDILSVASIKYQDTKSQDTKSKEKE